MEYSSDQINHIPGTAKDVDCEGEQENKKKKIYSGLIGITRGVNCRDIFFLISHVLSEIKNELKEISKSQKNKTEIKHALN